MPYRRPPSRNETRFDLFRFFSIRAEEWIRILQYATMNTRSCDRRNCDYDTHLSPASVCLLFASMITSGSLSKSNSAVSARGSSLSSWRLGIQTLNFSRLVHPLFASRPLIRSRYALVRRASIHVISASQRRCHRRCLFHKLDAR